jgi:hypothetical protein
LFELFSRDVASEFERSAKKSPALALQQHAVGFSVDVVDNSAQVERDASAPQNITRFPARFLPRIFSAR